MTQSDLDALLQRFETSQATEADRMLLRQLLLVRRDGVNEQAVLQSGKYGVNVGEGRDIHIGDIIQGSGPELIRAIVQELLAFQSQMGDRDTELNESVPNDGAVELIQVEPEAIRQINSRLASINQIQSAQPLTDSQRAKLNMLKTKVQSLNKVDQTLKEIATNANQLLQDAIESLTEKLSDLNNSQPYSSLNINQSDCLGQQVEVIQTFCRELEEGKKVAEWLDKRRSHLAEILGQYALDTNPTIKDTAAPKKVEVFYFTIEQFLECLSHCLIWGNSSVLETPEIPKVFDDKLYLTAFERLRELIPKRFSNDGIGQLKEYIDCLLENLPLCKNLKI